MNYSFKECLVIETDRFLKTILGYTKNRRPIPSQCSSPQLSDTEKKTVERLMRINHVGEVCAQSLYQGQRLSCNDPYFVQQLAHAAEEEIDHLAWCHQRLKEVDGHRSYLLPLWSLGALLIGYSVGKIGIEWNLAFLAETEKQVSLHLEEHINRIPLTDQRSHDILTVMKAEEESHQMLAQNLGARDMPFWAQSMMKIASRIMTKTSYWL